MKQLIITVGLPGSGKTTWAKKYIADNSGWKIVCKDDLRAMLDNGKWSKGNEKLVEQVRDAAILTALDAGYHVIVADTNFEMRHIDHITELVKGKAVVEVESFVDVPLETCIQRDLLRFNSVGETVIRGMWKKYIQQVEPEVGYDDKLPSCIICDLDGTAALIKYRDPYDTGKCDTDVPNFGVWSILKVFETMRSDLSFLPECVEIIMVSGRSDEFRKQTEFWLTRKEFPYAALHMRKKDDKRKDAIVKKEIYDEYIRGKYNVLFILDDRNSVVDMWRSLGLRCFQVAEGDF